MGICWYCYWGWPEPVAKIYQEAVKQLGGNDWPLLFGPSYIVWEDENWDSAEWCLEHFDKYKGNKTKKELEIIKWSLEELAKIPIEDREVEPENYDGEHPELFPPKKGVVMVRV